MRRKEKSIIDKLDLNSIKKEAKSVSKEKILKHPIIKVILVGVSIYGFLCVSRHFVNAYANSAKVSGVGKSIYPNEMVTVLNFNFHIKRFNFEEAKKQLKFRITLFYPNGKETIEIEFGELNLNQK